MTNFFDQYLIQPFIFLFLFLFLYINDPGWVIIIITLFLRIILFPLNYLIYIEETKIKIATEKINQLTKGVKDLMKKSEIISKVYQEENIHPLKNLILQMINLPILIAFFLAILKFLNIVNNSYFLNFIDLKTPNIILSLIVILFQIYFLFTLTNPQNRKLALFLSGVIIPIFFTLSAGLLIYIFINQIAVILEKKIIFTQKINKTIVSVKKNNT